MNEFVKREVTGQKRAVAPMDGFIGIREFVTTEGVVVGGELFKERGAYLAQVGHTVYPTTFMPTDNGKVWRLYGLA